MIQISIRELRQFPLMSFLFVFIRAGSRKKILVFPSTLVEFVQRLQVYFGGGEATQELDQHARPTFGRERLIEHGIQVTQGARW